MEETPVRVLLVDTNPPWVRGSMLRYANLVEHALSGAEVQSRTVEVRRLNLSPPLRLPKWIPEGLRSWLNHLWLLPMGPLRIRRRACDLVHLLDGSYAYLLDREYAVPVTATVHDLIPVLQRCEHLGAEAPSRLAGQLTRSSLRGLARCSRLLCVSANTNTDLLRMTSLDGARVDIVQNPLDASFLAASQRERKQLPADLVVLTPTILHVGNNAHYKNRPAVVRIFARIRSSVDARLVMAGPPPTLEVRQLVAKLGLQDLVVFVAVSDDAQLVELYSGASVFLFPSLYEGFGWPPLEAMACGCPVVCSDAASLPEVVGDAALTAPVEEEEQLAEHCLALLTDPLRAEEYSRRGREWARQFTPERMQREIAAFYARVLDEPR
jgi:glycosyltransferase involved in cell wall biosynthesis